MWWKCVYYRNLDTLKQWLGRHQPAKVIEKSRFGPKLIMCVSWKFEVVTHHWEFVPNGHAVDADLYSQQLERVHRILRRRYPALINRNRVLLQQDNARPHTARTIMAKFRNWEESNCYHTQHTSLILRLQIIICFNPWPLSCVQEISKYWSCGSGSRRILRIKNHRLVLSRDNKPRWKMAQDHRIWRYLLTN